jgi:hypothetical protein
LVIKSRTVTAARSALELRAIAVKLVVGLPVLELIVLELIILKLIILKLVILELVILELAVPGVISEIARGTSVLEVIRELGAGSA